MDFGFLFAKYFHNFIPIKEKRRALRGQLEAYKITTIIDGKKQRKPRFKELKGYNVQNKGKNNQIQLYTPLSKMHVGVLMIGDNNTLILGGKNVGDLKFYFNEDCGYVRLGEGSSFLDVSFFPSSYQIEVGNGCMFSRDVQVYGHDQHVLLDAQTKKIINQKVAPTRIGNHCWIGARVTILKGVHIPNQTIVGSCSVVTKSFTEEYTALGGNPAKLIKSGITWSRESVSGYLKHKKVKI